ncbi:AAA domain-containing protein [Kribbella sp. NPDC000426]|uniref:caspase, EACC1-associated type n=1 Tax=Kribbella sp. NPDC000426 TaxID=3154255 RepID=UPI003316C48A
MARHALLLGAATFPADPALRSLPGVRHDVDQLKAVLDQAGQFESVDAFVDLGRDQMVTKIEQFYQQRRFGDLALLYYSGHGLLADSDAESLFLATRDSDSRGSLHASGVDADGVLRHCLNTTKATQKVLLLDCCFSGAFELRNRFRGGVRQEPRRGLREHGTFVLTASTHLRAAKAQGDGLPSVFTAAVLDGLRGAASTSDSQPWITTNDLARHVHQALRTFGPVESSEGVTEPIKLVGTAPSSGPRAGNQPQSQGGDADADLDIDQWRRLVNYYRRCLRRGAELGSFLQRMQRDTYIVSAPGPEAVFSAGPDQQPHNPEFAAFAAKQGSDQQIRYGYPVLLMPSGAGSRDHRFAPLLVCDAIVTAQGQVLASPPELNRPVGVELGLTDPELDDLARQVDETFVAGDRHALAEVVRRLMEVLGLQGAGSMDPAQLSGQIAAGPVNRVQNTAILCAADLSQGAQGRLLEDLENLSTKPKESLSSSAGTLAELGSADERQAGPITIVAPDRLNETQEQIIRSAMTQRLTVAQGPPGTGKSQLVAALVATATAAGQTVLVGSTNNRAVDEVCQRIDALLGPGLLMRTGNRQVVARESDVLRHLIQRGAAADVDARTPAAELRIAAEEIGELRAALDLQRQLERDLADLVVERAGHQPVEQSDEELVLGVRLAERAAAGGLFAWWWRWRLRSRGWSAQGPLAEFALRLTVELKWRSARRRLAELPDVSAVWHRLGGLTAEERPQASLRLLSAQLQDRLRSGHSSLETRIRELSKAPPRTWTGFTNLLRTLPAWATTTMSARGLQPQPEIFDLVIIDEAAQCTIPAVLPMLFRARRVLIIGDPFQLSPVVTLPAPVDVEMQRESGLSREWLERRQLTFTRYSAYEAFEAVAGRVFLLDEHYRCHPQIIAAPNRRVYQHRLTVLTPPTESNGDTVTWRHVTGAFSHGGSGSGWNRAEIEAVVDEVRELRTAYPGSSIGVVTPLAAQSMALDCALNRAGIPPDEVVRGTIHKFQGGEKDIMVISPVGAHGVRRPTQHWLVNQLNLWNVAITRARSRLIVVGDEDWWSGQSGLLPEVLRPDSGDEVGAGADDATDRLHAAFRRAGLDVARDQRVQGRRYDLLVEGKLLVHVDDPRGDADGRALRKVLATLDVRCRGYDLVRVPLWRCLHDPEQMVSDVLADVR